MANSWRFKFCGILKFAAIFNFAAFSIGSKNHAKFASFYYSRQNSWSSDICGIFLFVAKFAS